MIKYLLLLCLFIQADDVPLKPADEFEIKLDYKFKNRNATSDNNYKVDFEETIAERERKSSNSLLPYLMLNIKLLKLSDQETRVKAEAVGGKILVSRKVSEGELIKMDLGFTDDLKDRINPHEYNLYLLSPDKKETTRIHLLVKEDGTFLVNDKVKGKF